LKGPRIVDFDIEGVELTRFGVLGPVEASINGYAVPLGPPKRRCVLALLLLELGQVVHVDHMVDVLWPDAPPPAARRVVLVHISRLRAALAAAGSASEGVEVVTVGAGYALHANPDLVDARRFRSLCEQAHTAGNDEKMVALLSEALELWRGPALSGVAEEDVRWRLAQGLDEARVLAQEDRIDAQLRLGHHGFVLDELTDLVHRYPFRERPIDQLMLALHRSGRSSDALDVCRAFRKRLSEGLGLDSSTHLRDLEASILRRDPTLDLPAVVSLTGRGTVAEQQLGTVAEQHQHTVPAQLPPSVAGLTGRNRELAHLDRLLSAAGAQSPAAIVISAICGAAGIGKTTLAVHWAHRVAKQFDDGQLYVNLRGFDPGGTAVDPADDMDASAAYRRSLVGTLVERALQQAITGGQCEFPDGLFYGGVRPAWSNRVLRSVETELNGRGYPTKRYAVSHMSPLVHAIRIVDGRLDGGADPAGDGMAASV